MEDVKEKKCFCGRCEAKIVGLFCKRDLLKRRHSTRDTYNCKEPTNHSHPVTRSLCGRCEGCATDIGTDTDTDIDTHIDRDIEKDRDRDHDRDRGRDIDTDANIDTDTKIETDIDRHKCRPKHHYR